MKILTITLLAFIFSGCGYSPIFSAGLIAEGMKFEQNQNLSPTSEPVIFERPVATPVTVTQKVETRKVTPWYGSVPPPAK